MLTEPVTVFFKFVIGRYEFFAKLFLTFSQNDYHHFHSLHHLALDIQDVKIISPVFYNCYNYIDNLLFLTTGNSVKIPDMTLYGITFNLSIHKLTRVRSMYFPANHT